MTNGELKDLLFMAYMAFYVLVWIKVIILRIDILDFILILFGNYLIIQRCLLVRRLNRTCAELESIHFDVKSVITNLNSNHNE